MREGPVVIENPGPIIGLINDAFFRYVIDVGFPGPDLGKGGKYLVVGPDYRGVPDKMSADELQTLFDGCIAGRQKEEPVETSSGLTTTRI